MAEQHDRLLEWCSVRRDGTRAAFIEATQSVFEASSATDPHRVLSNLERLGHLEVSWASRAVWCVTPAALSLLPNSGGNALIAGMRPPGFEDVVRDYAGRHGMKFTALQQADGPAAWYLGCADTRLVSHVAGALGLALTPRAARRYADLLPTLSRQVEAHRCAFSPGRTAGDVFIAESLAFEPYDGPRELPEGLYSFQDYGPPRYVVAGPGAARAVIHDRWVAIQFELLRQRRQRNLPRLNTVSWDSNTETLYSRAKIQLPPLAARAATLSSGLLPERRWLRPDPNLPEAQYDCYSGVVAAVFNRIRAYLQLDERMA